MKRLLWVGLVLLTSSGCGGSAQQTAPESAGAGGSHSGASSSAGSGSSGNSSAGFGGVSEPSGAGFGGVSGGRASIGGAGGKVPDFPGGSAGEGPLACSAPYAGPSGGPRADGPTNLGNCAGITDDVVLARYRDRSARVAQGLYYEPTESITFWNEPCSQSVEETVARGVTGGIGTFVESYVNEWFYEAVYCRDEKRRRIERNLRCDYFDGARLAKPTPERLAFLASMLWWGNYGNFDGSVVLGHSVNVGDATDIVELCTISATYGDFGLCDEVQLERTHHLLRFDGTVQLGMPEVVRTLTGDCH